MSSTAVSRFRGTRGITRFRTILTVTPSARADAITGLLRRSGGSAVTTLVGQSMEPTIPDGTRIRIQFGSHTAPDIGEIVVVPDGATYVVHRVVRIVPARGKRPLVLITRGDNRFIPDPPVALTDVVGRVTAVEQPQGWITPTPSPPDRSQRPYAVAILSAVHRLAILHPGLARAFMAAVGTARTLSGRMTTR